jgi:protein-S-isoprenylcysteine O-methyltransferase Ste14
MPGRSFGERGGWWVLGQFALLAAIILAPGGSPSRWPAPAPLWRASGAVLLAAAAAVLTAGTRALGKRLTPFPRPLEESTLVTTGIYRYVRHPLYFGVILASIGIALLKTSLPALILTAVLIAFFNAKAEREETWLLAQFPEYENYRRKSRKFLPFVL